jgi:hypothetical protein
MKLKQLKLCRATNNVDERQGMVYNRAMQQLTIFRVDIIKIFFNELSTTDHITVNSVHCHFLSTASHRQTPTTMAKPQPPPPAIQVSQATFNCLIVMIFVLCSCNIALVFWAVEKDLVMSVASNVHLKSGAQRLLDTVKAAAKEKVLIKVDDTLTPDEAIKMASSEQQFALQLLLDAGIDVTEDIVKQLPLLSDIHAQYGDKPIIHNLESCKRFRDTYKPEERFLAVAGEMNVVCCNQSFD